MLVTGGSKGIGRGIAQRLHAAGHRVAATYRSGGVPDGILGVQCEITDPEQVEAAFKQVEDALGPIEVLVANAGITRDTLLMRMSEDDWDAVVKVHLRGHYAPSRHACAYWRDRAKEIDGPVHASVICTSSLVGLEGNIGQTNYAAAKGGIAMFAIALALEMERYGVRANCVAPSGTTRWPLFFAAGVRSGFWLYGTTFVNASSGRRTPCAAIVE